jgi:hypothetical protein
MACNTDFAASMDVAVIRISKTIYQYYADKDQLVI